MAVILVAKGHGLIEAEIPSHRAASNAKIDSTLLLLDLPKQLLYLVPDIARELFKSSYLALI